MDHITKSWEGKTIRFRESDNFGCLTDMAKATGKNVADWQRLKSTNEYLECLSSIMGNPIDQLLQSKVGGNFPVDELGTWGERKICIRFAQWCSPDFAVQVDIWMEELMTKGSVSLKQMSPGEILIAQGQAMLALEQKQQQLELEQQKQSQALIQQAVELAVAKALAEQNQLAIASQQTEIDSLKLSLEALRSIINQPLTTCKQTTRQRIVETVQLIGRVIFERGIKKTLPDAMREAWALANLKIKHSSARRDLPKLKANCEKRYEQALADWKQHGGVKPKKKDYCRNYAELIEQVQIEDEALSCVNTLALEFI